MSTARILVADDEPSIRWLLERLLQQAGHSVTVVEDGATALARAVAEPFDLAFVDVRMPGLDGLEALSQLRVEAPDTAVIVMTAHGSVRAAVEAMQRGAYDYLTKPFDNDEVRLLVGRALSAKALAREVVLLRTGIHEVWEFGALVGKSARMQEVYKTIGRIAGTDVTILLLGESGTGKEVVARAIHHYSRRAGKPFVAVACAAIPPTLLESELFGHERGAFTDAHQRRLGAASNPDRRAGLLHRLGVDAHLVEPREAAVEGGRRVAPERAHDVDGLGDAGPTLVVGHTAHLELLRVLATDAHAEDEPPAREHVEGGAHLGRHRGGAERQQIHARPELDPAGDAGVAREQGERLEDRVVKRNVIARPDGLEAQFLEATDETKLLLGRAQRWRRGRRPEPDRGHG